MITCATCQAQYNIKAGSKDEVRLFSVMRPDPYSYKDTYKAFFCSQKCYESEERSMNRLHRSLKGIVPKGTDLSSILCGLKRTPGHLISRDFLTRRVNEAGVSNHKLVNKIVWTIVEHLAI